VAILTGIEHSANGRNQPVGGEGLRRRAILAATDQEDQTSGKPTERAWLGESQTNFWIR
jgi:hypothetical protein